MNVTKLDEIHHRQSKIEPVIDSNSKHESSKKNDS